MWQTLATWFICRALKHHTWVLIEEYPQMIKAQIFTGEGFEKKEIPSPFKKDKISGKWVCRRCRLVSVGTRHIL